MENPLVEKQITEFYRKSAHFFHSPHPFSLIMLIAVNAFRIVQRSDDNVAHIVLPIKPIFFIADHYICQNRCEILREKKTRTPTTTTAYQTRERIKIVNCM